MRECHASYPIIFTMNPLIDIFIFQILCNAVKTAMDKTERNSLTMQMAFVRNIRPEILADIEKIIQSSNDTTDPLILSYGALSSSSPQLRHRILQFLQERLYKAMNNATILIHLIHSSGNTESSLAESTLLQFIAHHDSGVRLAAVYALRYSIESKDVQFALSDGLRNHQDTDFAEMVARALIAGAEWKQYSESGAIPVGDNLFEAIMQHAKNNTQLRAMVYYYQRLPRNGWVSCARGSKNEALRGMTILTLCMTWLKSIIPVTATSLTTPSIRPIYGANRLECPTSSLTLHLVPLQDLEVAPIPPATSCSLKA